MPWKKFAATACVFALSAAAAPAANVSFLAIDVGASQGEPGARNSTQWENAPGAGHSTQWENALMEVFFDLGHIVSNAPRMQIQGLDVPEGLPPEALSLYEEARAGHSHYFLVAIVRYPERDVSLRLFGAREREPELIAETIHPGASGLGTNEENERMRSAARAIAALLGSQR